MSLNRSAVLENGKKVLTMTKYIEAARAATIIEEKLGIPIADLVDAFAEIPAADVAEVVRCKDCLYSTERYGHMECIHGVSYRNTWNKPDFFCVYGKRKEGAD